jgi:protoheme IX farnesyltransferase
LKASPSIPKADAAAEPAGASYWSDLSVLVKARLTLLVMLTTLVGFLMGREPENTVLQLVWAMLGTGLVACGSSALNQLQEHRSDEKMVRTRHRPLPARKMTPDSVLIFGFFTSVAGLGILAWQINLLTAALAGITLGTYLFIYTPMKKVSTFNTVVGAVPGALPPLLGWTAARGAMDVQGWILFSILFLWQIPHFMAIAWMYRDDYERGGLHMITRFDTTGRATGQQALIYALGLIPVSMLPSFWGMTGLVYLGASFLLGAFFAWKAWEFVRRPEEAQARSLFFLSILYLPLLLAVMVLDRA